MGWRSCLIYLGVIFVMGVLFCTSFVLVICCLSWVRAARNVLRCPRRDVFMDCLDCFFVRVDFEWREFGG